MCAFQWSRDVLLAAMTYRENSNAQQTATQHATCYVMAHALQRTTRHAQHATTPPFQERGIRAGEHAFVVAMSVGEKSSNGNALS